MKYIPRAVWILSLVSLLTDTASEMLYPVMPLFLQGIGFSVLYIGILEGIAEATAGLSKGYFGNLSDARGRRVPFVQAGYALSAISKPMMAFIAHPLWILLARTLDRLGKGVRTGARDALLSDAATPATKGRIFGLHRAMDTAGAVLGPSLALAYLAFFPEDYVTLFYLAFLPGFLAIVTTLLLRENKIHTENKKVSFFSYFQYWKKSPAAYRRLTGALLLFALVNSSDVFLLLKMKEAGLSDTAVIGVYIFYNLVYAISALPLGILGDRIGLKAVLAGGLFVFAFVYGGMALADNVTLYLTLFFFYGMYAAATEGIAKAWVSNIVSPKDTATAIGAFAGLQSVATLLASSLAGLLWFQFGATAVFATAAVVSLAVAVYLWGVG